MLESVLAGLVDVIGGQTIQGLQLPEWLGALASMGLYMTYIGILIILGLFFCEKKMFFYRNRILILLAALTVLCGFELINNSGSFKLFGYNLNTILHAMAVIFYWGTFMVLFRFIPKAANISSVVDSEKKLQRITDAIPHGIILLSNEKRIIAYNTATQVILKQIPNNFDKEIALDKHILSSVKGNNLRKMTELFQECTPEHPGPFYKTFNFYTSYNRLKPQLSFKVSLMYIEDKFNFSYLMTLTDLTPQKSIEMDLEMSNARLYHQTEQLNAILHNMADGVITTDDKGTIETLNPAAESLLGYDSRDLKGKHIKILMPQKSKTRYLQFFKNYFDINEKKIFGIKQAFRVRHKSGKLIPIYLGISEISIQGKTKFCGIMRDLTALKEHEEQLIKQSQKLEEKNNQLQILNKDLEFFNYFASHDLNEPIRSINHYCELIKRDMSNSLTSKAKSYFDNIQKSVIDMRFMITGLRDFNKLRSKTKRWEPVNVEGICHCVSTGLRQAYPNKKISLTLDIQGIIMGCPEMLQILITNLFDNSIKYSQNDTVNIQVSLQTCPDGSKNLVIQDDGIGIAEKYQPKIFELFYRLHSKDKISGAGIGLAMCKRIIEMHRGAITVHSTPGVGTTFNILFPKPEKAFKQQKNSIAA